MGEWKEYRLGDIVTFGNGKVRPKEIGEYPIYGGNGILGYGNTHNYQGETVISQAEIIAEELIGK